MHDHGHLLPQLSNFKPASPIVMKSRAVFDKDGVSMRSCGKPPNKEL